MKRIVYSAAAYLTWLTISYLLLGEAVVRYKMWALGATRRIQLADDTGYLLLGVFVVIPISIVIGAIGAWVTWRRMAPRQQPGR